MNTNQIQIDNHVAASVALFAKYSTTLESEFSSKNKIDDGKYPGILNGEASKALQTLVPLEIRKEAGIFFTNTKLANSVAAEIVPMLKQGITICDPASGAGNLLIACAQHLPFGKCIDETIRTWSEWISGYDLFPEFIRAAKLRLLILALQHHNVSLNHHELNLTSVFENLKTENVFTNKRELNSECLIMNPPFGYMTAPEDCTWASGQIQIAGWFLENILKVTQPGRHIVAILPDVLNSGSRYERWRNVIVSHASRLSIKLAGRFDKETDVNVFILHMVTGKGQASWPRDLDTNSGHKLTSDFFEVRVGAVVPHRDPEDGNEYPYIHARTAPKGQIITEVKERKKFSGTVFKPPFVLIHRTSSPSDKIRCVATIVNIDSYVAVENHLLVCIPKDGLLSSCKKLLKSLASEQTTVWMNNRICCRHLTVDSLKEVPLLLKRSEEC